jgi:hypothetical protein
MAKPPGTIFALLLFVSLFLVKTIVPGVDAYLRKALHGATPGKGKSRGEHSSPRQVQQVLDGRR